MINITLWMGSFWNPIELHRFEQIKTEIKNQPETSMGGFTIKYLIA